MTKNILFAFICLYSISAIGQNKYWVSAFEIRDSDAHRKRYSDANRILVKQSKDSLQFYDVAQEAFNERFKLGFAFKRGKDSKMVHPKKRIEYRVIEKKDRLVIWYNKESVYTFLPLKKVKTSKKKIEKVLFSEEFIIRNNEFYYPFSGKSNVKKVRFSKNQITTENTYIGRIFEIENRFFFALNNEPQKFFPIKKISSKGIELIAPNSKNSDAILKITK